MALLVSCNALTGANDLEVLRCELGSTEQCTGPEGCTGLRTCEDGEYSLECQCNAPPPCDVVYPTYTGDGFQECASGEYCSPGIMNPSLAGISTTSYCSAGAPSLNTECTWHTECLPGFACDSAYRDGQCASWCRTDFDCIAFGGGPCLDVAPTGGDAFLAGPDDVIGVCGPG